MMKNPGTPILLLLLIVLLRVAPFAAFAHGEDKPGPHGGQIRMPGTFHTELVPAGKNEIKVFLLDVHWKHPTAKGKVTARMEQKAINCTAQKNSFLCSFPPEMALARKGVLWIRAEREGSKGMEVSYELPLQGVVK